MKFEESLPFGTIAIPAYNHERYIKECLESAAAQTYPNLDLVVVDDGSTDSTLKCIEEFVSANRSRFRDVQVNSRPNRGVAATMNEIIERARTEWIFMSASDDVMYPNRVEAQMRAIEAWDEPELTMVFGLIDWIDQDSRPIDAWVENTMEAGVHRDAYLGFVATNPPHGATTALRRDAAIAVGGYHEDMPFEDMTIALELSVRYSIGMIREKLAAYRRHDDNLSSRKNYAKMIWGMLITAARFLEQHGDKVPVDWKYKVYRKQLLRTIRCLKWTRPAALPGLVWELVNFDAASKTPNDLFRYAGLVEPLIIR